MIGKSLPHVNRLSCYFPLPTDTYIWMLCRTHVMGIVAKDDRFCSSMAECEEQMYRCVSTIETVY